MHPPAIAYLAHDLADAAVARRIAMLRTAGAGVALAGFSRSRAAPESIGGVAPLTLGRTEDARLVQRAVQVARAVLFQREKLCWHIRGADAIVARNLEMLVIGARLASLLNPRPRLIYECLDLHRLISAPGSAGNILRAVERRAGAGVDAVLTSSPGFIRNHFAGTLFADRVHLIENRVFVADGHRLGPTRPRLFGPPWRIGWFGALRCRRSFEMLSRLARTHQGRVEVIIRGRPSPAVFPSLAAESAGIPGLRFEGPYRWPDDLPVIYGGVHFSWCIDFYEQGANSEWLLPNRLYEGSLFGAVPIALAQTETGRWLSRRALGETIAGPAEASLDRLFAEMTPERYRANAERLAAEPRGSWLADSGACDELLDIVLGRRPAPRMEAA